MRQARNSTDNTALRKLGPDPDHPRGDSSRIGVIYFKVTTPLFVVVAPTSVQAIVDFDPIDEKSEHPDCEKKQCDTKQKPENDR
jgi:hypothetical protein